MGVSLANPGALWALLGLPAVLAVHFLQSRHRRREISTLFLVESLPEDTRSGAVFTRLRTGPQLWLQLLAVLLLTLLLSRPMWLRPESVQSVAVVMDVSTSMRAFRDETVAVVRDVLTRVDGVAGHTEWWLLPSDPTRPRLYHGEEVGEAIVATEKFDPRSGPHDPRAALMAARRQIGPEGLLIWVTDHPESSAPADAVVLGTGSPLPNSGFSGIRFSSESGRTRTWEASLLHFGPEPVEKEVRVVLDGNPSETRKVRLIPGAVTRLKGAAPPEVTRGRIELEGDAYEMDDVLPFVVPRARPLPYAVGLSDSRATWVERVMGTVPGSVSSSEPVVVWREFPGTFPPAGFPGELYFAGRGEPAPYAPAVPTDHPLVRDLSWSGFLGRPLADWRPAAGEEVLVWSGATPLITLRSTAAGEQVWLNFRFEDSNADRLPAMVLFLHRFLRRVGERVPGTRTENLETRQALSLPEHGEEPITWRVESLSGEVESRTLSSAPLRAPDLPGFVTVSAGTEEMLRAAVIAGDVEEADLRTAASRSLEESVLPEQRRRNSEVGFLTPLWFTLLGMALAGSWVCGEWRGGS